MIGPASTALKVNKDALYVMGDGDALYHALLHKNEKRCLKL